jgi:hypothetical protein
MKIMLFTLPEDSILRGDNAYTDYKYEQIHMNAVTIKMMIVRKSNTTQHHEPCEDFMIADSGKIIRTTFGKISSMSLNCIHGVTPDRYLMKVVLFIFVFTINKRLYM